MSGSPFTLALSDNADGYIVGSHLDGTATVHGFLRKPSGNIASFDPTGSIQTLAYSIDSNNEIAGSYSDKAGVLHGFLRTSQ